MVKPASIAFSSAAPADERYDAQAEIQKESAPRSQSDLLFKRDDLKPLLDFISAGMEEQALSKSLQRASVIPFPSHAVKHRQPGMQSVWLDDMQVTVQGDWYEKPGAFSFDAMRALVGQVPVLNSVIMTRQRQVQRFCRPQQNGKGPGFKIALKDKDAHAGTEEQQSIIQLQDFFTHCGWERRPRQRMRLRRDDFASFMAKLVRESLTMDSMPIETEWKRDRSLGLDGMYAVDGATIRLCAEQGYRGDDEIYALQLVQGQIRAAYTYDDLIYVPRNPCADVLSGGYGIAETELLVRVVTGFLNAFTYNTKYFDSNSIPKGVLNLYGNFSPEDINGFKRHWNAMVKGINNTWALPVMVSKDGESKASFENFGVEIQDAMFTKWMTFLVSIICAVYGIAPDEINFESFTNGTSSLSGSDTEEKLVNSKDKGLRPLLSYFENLFSDYVVAEYGDKYVFRFTGLDEEDPKSVFERQKLTMTWDEMRALDDLPKVPGKLGDAPLNPALMGAWQAENQQPPEDYGVPGGSPGADEDGADFGESDADADDGGTGDGGADFGTEADDAADDDMSPDGLSKAFGLPIYKIEV